MHPGPIEAIDRMHGNVKAGPKVGDVMQPSELVGCVH